MKTLGRILEVNINGRYGTGVPFKNKYVIVYENKSYFVCKEFGTDYPKIIKKSLCITLEEFYSPNRTGYCWYVIDRNHESDIKIDLSNIRVSQMREDIRILNTKIYNEKERVIRDRKNADELENKIIPELETKLKTMEKELDEIYKKAIADQNAFDEFGIGEFNG